MSEDHQADRVGVDQSDIEDERDEVVLKYDRLEIEVRWNESPSGEVWKETVEGFEGVFFPFSLHLHHM